MRIVDLSHVVEDGMETYPGLPGPRITDHLSREASRAHYAPGTEFHIGRIEMVANTGTYLDTPAHRFADGTDLSETPLQRMVELDGVLIDVVGEAAIGHDALSDDLAAVDVRNRAVLLRTDHARRWGTEAYLRDHPFLTADGAAYLAEGGAALVGIDSLNVDGTSTGERPAHTTLLGAGIPVVEHLCRLDELPRDGFRFSAAPVAVRGLGTFPVRAYAVVPDRP